MNRESRCRTSSTCQGWRAAFCRTRSSRPSAAFNVLVAWDTEGCVVLYVPTGTYLRLDSVASEILDLVQKVGESDAVAAFADRHGLDSEKARADVASVLHAIRTGRASPKKLWNNPPSCRGAATVVREWLRLSRHAKFAILDITAIIMLVEVAIRFIPIDRLANRLGTPIAEQSDLSFRNAQILDLSQLTDHELIRMEAVEWTFARWIFDATCLRRALVCGWILRHRDPKLHIGMMEASDGLAHAWLEIDRSTLGALGGVRHLHRLRPLTVGTSSRPGVR